MELVTVKNKHKKLIDKLKIYSKINPINIDKEMYENPSRIFFVNIKLTDAEHILKISKANLARTKNDAIKRWSKKKIEGKKLTKIEIESRVGTDEDVIKSENTCLELEYLVNVCKGGLMALKEKGQQLTNISNNRRAESKYNYVKEAKEERRKNRF